MLKRVFIGSSSESLPIARAIQKELKQAYTSYFPVIWYQDVLQPTKYTIPELIGELSKSDYAIFVFSDDDKLTTRKKAVSVPRDNVVFECGIATGLIGIHNCFVVKSKKAKLPSDFNGLTVIEYELSNGNLADCKNLRAEFGPAVSQFDEATKTVSNYEIPEKIHSWLKYCDSITSLCNKLLKSSRNGGFRFDAIVGITRGGIIAADIINRKCMTPTPLLCITPSYSDNGDVKFKYDEESDNYWALNALSKFQNILLVDDISRSGQTIPEAKALLTFVFPDKTIKTAAVFVPEKHKKAVDFYGSITNKTTVMPYSMF